MELAVIGGGASGMMAACTAARMKPEIQISLYDAGVSPGVKLLATGNGHCNFTNLNMNTDCFYSDHPDFLTDPLAEFSEQDTLDFFRSLGVPAKEKNGYCYPMSDQASTVQEALVLELIRRRVKLHSSSRVIQIQHNEDGSFTLELDSGYQRTVDTVILACGSKAMPSSGCDGHGYTMAESMGHRVIPVVPALTGLNCSDDFCGGLHGVRVKGSIRLTVEDREAGTEAGEIQLVRSGISGIPVFQICRVAARILQQGKLPVVHLSTLNEEEILSFRECFSFLRSSTPDMTVKQMLHGYFPEKLSSIYMKLSGVFPQTCLQDLSTVSLDDLCRVIRDLPFHVSGTGDYSQAQACAGGIDVSEVEPLTMGSKRIPGLYFAGEILDVDGICGGYNLQWAWTSGYLAGRAAAKECSEKPKAEQIPIRNSMISLKETEQNTPKKEAPGRENTGRAEQRKQTPVKGDRRGTKYKETAKPNKVRKKR